MIRAVIFDLDGTLAATEPLHLEALSRVLAAEGIEVAKDDYYRRLVGCNDRECFVLLLGESHRPAGAARIDELTARKSALYRQLIAGRDLLYPGAADFVRRCAERFALIVATGTLRGEAELVLGSAGLRELFVDIIGAEDAERGKPEPDLLLAALGRLGFLLRLRPPLGPHECLVVEDTPAGIEAARRAGMRVLAVAHTLSEQALARADLVRASLAAANLDEVLRRLSGEAGAG